MLGVQAAVRETMAVLLARLAGERRGSWEEPAAQPMAQVLVVVAEGLPYSVRVELGAMRLVMAAQRLRRITVRVAVVQADSVVVEASRMAATVPEATF